MPFRCSLNHIFLIDYAIIFVFALYYRQFILLYGITSHSFKKHYIQTCRFPIKHCHSGRFYSVITFFYRTFGILHDPWRNTTLSIKMYFILAMSWVKWRYNAQLMKLNKNGMKLAGKYILYSADGGGRGKCVLRLCPPWPKFANIFTKQYKAGYQLSTHIVYEGWLVIKEGC